MRVSGHWGHLVLVPSYMVANAAKHAPTMGLISYLPTDALQFMIQRLARNNNLIHVALSTCPHPGGPGGSPEAAVDGETLPWHSFAMSENRGR